VQEVNVNRIRSRKEFAALLGISTRTLDRLDRKGKLPPRVKVTDRLIGYRETDISAFINSGGVR
jgi:predicted DNA-binding transcriptional regulator AlpA